MPGVILLFFTEKQIAMNKLLKTNFFRFITDYLQKKESLIDLNINYSLFKKELMKLINNQVDKLSLYRTLNYTLLELKALYAKIVSLEEEKKHSCCGIYLSFYRTY